MQVSFQLQGFPCRRRGGGLVLTAPLRVGPSASSGAQPMRNRRPSSSPIERLRTAIDCLPVATREAMLAGVLASERIIVGAYTDGRGGVCPMLAAHRAGARTDFLSFARAWDRFARSRGASRSATEREVRDPRDAPARQPGRGRRPGARPRDRRAPQPSGRRPSPHAAARRRARSRRRDPRTPSVRASSSRGTRAAAASRAEARASPRARLSADEP